MKNIFTIILFYFLIFSISFCQKPKFTMGVWNQEAISGKLTLEGQYRSQETILKSDFTERPTVTDFFGKLHLKSQSYLWHPNFVQLNISGKYNPGTKRENFLVMPDRSETKTAESIHFTSKFFKDRPLSFTLFSNLDHNYVNREYTTSVKITRTDFGGNVSFRNKKLPVTFNYRKSNWEQKEIQSGRVFENDRHNLRTFLNKNFGKKSRNSLSYSYDNYTRAYANNASVNNKTSNVNLSNIFNIDRDKGSRFTSQVNYFDKNGDQDLNRLQVNESLNVGLPKKFKFFSKYHFTRYEQDLNNSNQHNLLNRIEHQLFSSLKSQVFFEYFKFNRSAYDEKKLSTGISLNYTKSIPYGNLFLNYKYNHKNEKRDSRPFVLTVFNEEQQLTDENTILLDNPYIEIESIEVTDETGSVIYSKDIDYVVLQWGDYIKIQRFPGGQILNGDIVYIDYIVSKQTSYKFNTAFNNYNIRLNFLKNLFEVYFKYMEQDYNNINMTDSRILRTINQHVYGLKASKKFVTAGFELDDFNSNIIPYQSKRYYITIAGNFNKKISASLTGNHRKYDYTDEKESQKFTNIAGRINYMINRNSKFKLDGGLRIQDGRGVDLNLATLRSEYSMRWRRTFYALGVELYRRDFSGEIIKYNGVYLRFDRAF